MIYYYCENCGIFLASHEVIYRNGRGDFEAIPQCGICNAEYNYLLPCTWYMTGITHFPERVKSSGISLDKLKELCYTCNMRFRCWTGNSI